MASAPPWLEERFPRRRWASLRCCPLRVDPEQGAGLDMEETELGYQVDAVAASPGQDAALQPGDVIISIGGERLLGLPEGQVEAAFGERYRHGAELLLLRADELREAAVERDANAECPCEEPVNNDEEAPDEEERVTPPEESANYELLRRQKSETEREATVRIPVGRAMVWSLPPDTAVSLERDLEFLGSRFGLHAGARLNREGSMESVVLTGLPSTIARARPEVIQLLDFYRQGRWAQGAAGPAAADTGRVPEPVVASTRQADAAADDPPPVELSVPEHLRDLRQFQYHDHTADIIVHSWGRTREEAFAQVCVGMFQYMTELDGVALTQGVEVEASGHDLLDLLYHLLDEFLFVFSTQMHISRCVEILEFDEEGLRIRARGYGERMDLSKHSQGTEIKAITMHMMRILGPDATLTEGGVVARGEAAGEKADSEFPHEVYVLLDI